MLKTKKFSLRIDEQKGEVEINYGNGTMIKLSSVELTIEAPKLSIEGANGRKLEVNGVSARINQSGLEVL